MTKYINKFYNNYNKFYLFAFIITYLSEAVKTDLTFIGCGRMDKQLRDNSKSKKEVTFMKKLLKLKQAISTIVALTMLSPIFTFVSAEESNVSSPVLKLGDYIQMGTYDDMPITWRVMAFEKITKTNEDGTPVIDSSDTVYEYTEGYIPLLMTDNIITMKAFDAGVAVGEAEPTVSENSSHSRSVSGSNYRYREAGSNYWGDSNIRCWLNASAKSGDVDWMCGFAPNQAYMYPEANGYDNEAGFLNSFTSTELNAIISVSQKTLIDAVYDGTVDENYSSFDMPDYVHSADKFYDLYQYEYNTDTVFLPDIRQMYNIAQNANYLGGNLYLTSPTYYARQQIPPDSQYASMADTDYYPYWLRTPCDGSGCSMGIMSPSDAADIAITTANASDIGVRPACYIDMTALDMTSSDGTDGSPYSVYMPKYTVTYNAGKNGGTVMRQKVYYQSVKDGTEIISGNNTTAYKEGYDFIGWNTDPDAKEGLSSYKLAGDVTLYPIFLKGINVTFVGLGNTDTQTTKVELHNNDTYEITFPTLDDIETDAAKLKFCGWSSDLYSYEIEHKAGEKIQVNEDVTYYAVYSRDITVEYIRDVDRPDIAEKTETYTQYRNISETFPIKITAPEALTEDGKYFFAWISGNTIVPANGTAEIYDSMTFAADWSAEPITEYTITYDYQTNGGDSSTAATVTVKDHSLADLTPTAVKAGYEFIGWNTEPECCEGLTEYTVTQDATLYAIFKKTVSVRFYSRNSMVQKTVHVDIFGNNKTAVVELPSISSYNGWTLLGWRNDTIADEPKVIGAEDGAGEMEFSIDKTNFYAVYKRDIILSYELNGGLADAETQVQTQYYNSAGNISEVEFTLASAPSKDGDTFIAWEVDGKNYQPNDKVKLSESAVISAVWESTVSKYTVTYDYQTNGGTYLAAPADKVTANSGDKADLTVTAYKNTYDFIGWNIDKNATEALTQYTVDTDVTLYAIFKKSVLAQFMEEANKPQSYETVYVYNNIESAYITAPEPIAKDGWTTDGWSDSEKAAPAKFKSGKLTVNNDTYFYPVYKRFITLSYNLNGADGTVKPTSALQYMNGYDKNAIEGVKITLAAAPKRDGYKFVSWNVSADMTRGYQSGETVVLKENATAVAVWEKIEKPADTVSVTYDYQTNGGSRTTKEYDVIDKNSKATLTPIAVKIGYEFVGWNTDKDAKTALTEYTAADNATLYAIYKKDITINFYSGEGQSCETKTVTIYNNDQSTITTPEAKPMEGWDFVGWRDNKHANEDENITGNIKVANNTDFYAIYSRNIIVNEKEDAGATPNATNFKQYCNSAGGKESKTIMLEEPEPREGYRFRGWAIGDETGKRYKPGTPVSVSESTNLVGLWVKLPDSDVNLPTIQTGTASVSSPTSVTVSSKIESDGGDSVIEQGFVYWSKLDSGSKYTVLTSNNDSYTLSNLSPDTEYYYYAFAENAAGTGKGYIKSFSTSANDKANALMITPEYISVEKDSEYQLLATLLPASIKNRRIVWSSSDDSVATVDANGKIKGIKEGQAIITAMSEADRLTAECIVDVTETEEIKEYDFSEWNMATNTSNYAKDGLGFDWDTSNFGGNHQMATAYLARWDGAILEENDPYPEFNSNPAAGYKKASADYHIQDVQWLPAREDALDNDEIKSALMEYGAVYTLFNVDWQYFDNDMLNYYCPSETDEGGHCVTIVGWDDNYSKDNFVTKPPANGAFLCKNSWGEYVGDNGYFYISYYDAQMGRVDSNAVVNGFEKKTNYNKIYQYDPLGAVGYIGFGDTTYAANVFPENGKTLTQDEDLKAVSFYTYHKNTSYDVYIVTDYKDKASLSKLWSSSASGTIKNAGYHTIKLKTPINLKAGTRFAVVVKLDTPNETSYVYCEYPVEGYSSNARANADESYYSSEGNSWYDLTDDVDNANFCIKAFTDNGLAAYSTQLFSAINNAEREYESNGVYTLQEAQEAGLPINEDYADYVKQADNIAKECGQIRLMAVEDEKSFGSVPSITKAGANSVTFTDGAIFPSSYDLRKMGLVSSVKNQGEWGTCWAHTMYASLESNILRRMKTTKSDTNNADLTPEYLALSRSVLTMTPDSSMTLAKKITPIDVPNKAVVWISSDESIATVDTNGTIRAISNGFANITAATVSGGICAQCSVVVEDSDVEERVSLEEKTVNKSIGDVFMVAYSVTPMKSNTNAFGWISDNLSVASVNENGVITAKTNGTAKISIISDKGEIKDTLTVVVGNGFNCEIQNLDDNLNLDDSILSGSVVATIKNNTSSEKPSTIILALYDSNNCIVGTSSVSKALAKGDNEIKFEGLTFNGIQIGNYTLKCFTWDSFASMIPLSETANKSLLVEQP